MPVSTFPEKKIKKGQELLLSYGDGYWDTDADDTQRFDTDSITLAHDDPREEKDDIALRESRTACDDDEKDV